MGVSSTSHKEKHSHGMKRKALNGELQVLCNVNKPSKHQYLNSVRSEVPD